MPKETFFVQNNMLARRLMFVFEILKKNKNHKNKIIFLFKKKHRPMRNHAILNIKVSWSMSLSWANERFSRKMLSGPLLG